MIGFEKDGVGELLEKGAVDLALGVFPNPPRQTLCSPLFQEHFVGISHKNHPVIIQKPLSLEVFANLSHALVTIRRDTTGEIRSRFSSLQLTTSHCANRSTYAGFAIDHYIQ